MVSTIRVGNCGLIACEYKDSLSLIYQNKLAGIFNSNFKIIQTSNTVLQIYYHDQAGELKINAFDARFNLKCFDLAGSKLLIWNGCIATVCEINTANSSDLVKDVYSVNIVDAKFVALHLDNILRIDEYNISILNQEAVVKQDLTFPKSEGAITG